MALVVHDGQCPPLHTCLKSLLLTAANGRASFHDQFVQSAGVKQMAEDLLSLANYGI